jgi:hypothetical protein
VRFLPRDGGDFCFGAAVLLVDGVLGCGVEDDAMIPVRQGRILFFGLEAKNGFVFDENHLTKSLSAVKCYGYVGTL